MTSAGAVDLEVLVESVLRDRGRFAADALRRRMLAAADLGSVFLAALAVGAVQDATAAWEVIAFIPGWIIVAKLCGLYDRDHKSLRHLTVDDVPQLICWALASSALITVMCLGIGDEGLSVRGQATLWSVVIVTAILLRSVARLAWRHRTPPERLVVIGSGPLAAAVSRKLELFPDAHARVTREFEGPDAVDLSVDTSWLDDADRVVHASIPAGEAFVRELAAVCRERGVKLSVAAQSLLSSTVHVTHMADVPLFEFNTWDASRSTLFVKRALDLAVAVPLLVILSPVMVLAAFAVHLSSPGPVFFVQLRAGRGGKPFRLLKFRTMVNDAEQRLLDLVAFDDLPAPMFKLERDPRVTRVGRFLRRTSIDELPQLINVVRGEMSLVGPRPEQLELVNRYQPEHQFRLSVKPGLTGPMQVYGRGSLTFEERLAVERDYVGNLSLGSDLRILLMTLAPVVNGRGAY